MSCIAHALVLSSIQEMCGLRKKNIANTRNCGNYECDSIKGMHVPNYNQIQFEITNINTKVEKQTKGNRTKPVYLLKHYY